MHNLPAGPIHDVRRLWGGAREAGQAPTQEPLTATEAVSRAADNPHGPKDGIVAVKVNSTNANKLSSSKCESGKSLKGADVGASRLGVEG